MVADVFEKKTQDLEWRTSFDKVKGLEEKHQVGITKHMDLITIFDGSATEFNEPMRLNHLNARSGDYYGTSLVCSRASTTRLRTR